MHQNRILSWFLVSVIVVIGCGGSKPQEGSATTDSRILPIVVYALTCASPCLFIRYFAHEVCTPGNLQRI